MGPNDIIKKLWNKIPGEIKITFFSAIIIGLMAHMFMITNKLPNHDETLAVQSLFWTKSSGRWFLGFAHLISSTFSLPWVKGVLSIIYVAVTSCVIVSCYRIKTGLYCCFAAGLCITFPTVACTLGYMSYSDSFFLASLLACLSIFVTVNNKYGFVIGIPLLTLSLGIYQAYLCFATGLSIGILILDICTPETNYKQIINKSARCAATVTAGTIGYLVIAKITTPVLTDYQGISSMGQISISQLPSLIKKCFQGIYGYYFKNIFKVHYTFSKYIFVLIFIISLVLMVYMIFTKKIYKDPIRFIYLIGLFILFPIGCNIIHIMSPEGYIYLNVIFGLVLLPIFSIAILDLAASMNDKKHTAINMVSWALSFAFCVTIYNYNITANKEYLRAHYIYEQGYAFSSTLITRIESIEGFSLSKNVLFIGRPPYVGNPVQEFEAINAFAGVSYIPNTYSYVTFLNRTLGFSAQIKSLTEIADDHPLFDTIIEMPNYPETGSIKLMEDTVIVKFIDIEK